jgi:hypothetical protein
MPRSAAACGVSAPARQIERLHHRRSIGRRTRPFISTHECRETLQGVWGGVPGGLVSIVTHALLTDLPLRAVERRER